MPEENINTKGCHIMDRFVEIVFTVFSAIVVLAGAAVLIIGIRRRIHEKKNCTLSTFGIVKEIEYSYDNNDFEPDKPSTPLYGLRLLVNIDDTEYDVFNEEYSSSCNYRKGDAVPIMIDPYNPNDYYINDGSAASIFLILLGIGMMIAGVILGKYL